MDEEIIELTDIVEDESHDLDLDIVKEEHFEEELVESVQDLSVSPEVLEAALERVIEKKFADKIEAILFEVMEKVIGKEIGEIKESLQKDLDQIGNY
ncbi:MAG: hypothetical protein GXP56_05775 [Deltaproteobacteria bacterium]|nr:hypothetical protein [Deltaproteobacteria bacterium]